MRTAIASLALLPLLLPLLASARQEEKPGDAERDRAFPFTAYRERERSRFEEGLQGAWILTSFHRPGQVFGPGDVAGFAMFVDGFLSLELREHALEDRLLGPRRNTYVQAGVHRYRISGEARLQTAALMGFATSDDGELQVEPASFPREFQVELTEGTLVLRRWDGESMTFRRAKGGAFPKKAAELLERNRGRNFELPADW